MGRKNAWFLKIFSGPYSFCHLGQVNLSAASSREDTLFMGLLGLNEKMEGVSTL